MAPLRRELMGQPAHREVVERLLPTAGEQPLPDALGVERYGPSGFAGWIHALLSKLKV